MIYMDVNIVPTSRETLVPKAQQRSSPFGALGGVSRQIEFNLTRMRHNRLAGLAQQLFNEVCHSKPQSYRKTGAKQRSHWWRSFSTQLALCTTTRKESPSVALRRSVNLKQNSSEALLPTTRLPTAAS